MSVAGTDGRSLGLDRVPLRQPGQRADTSRLENAYDVQHITSFAGGVNLAAVIVYW